MPTPTSPTELIFRMQKLPSALRNFLSSTDVANNIEEIQSIYGLSGASTIALSRAIAWYVSGFLSAQELGAEISAIAPKGKLAELRSDILKKIFMPFATQLHEHGLNFEAILSTAAAPSAAPQPVPVSPMQGASPPTPAKPSPEPIVISAAPQKPTPPPIVIQAPAASVKEKVSAATSPPLSVKPPAIVNQKSVVSSQLSVVSNQESKPSPVVSTAAATPPLSKPSTAQLPTAAPKITIAGQQPGVPTTPIQEETPQKTQPEITPKAIRYTPAPVIREVPKVISPTDGKKPQEPQQQITPQQIPSPQPKPQSPVIDLSTFQIIQNAPPPPGSQDKAQSPAPSMPPGTPSAQPKAKGNMIDLKGFL
jgi:hypothetical protein